MQFAILLVPSPALADLDPQTDKPYQLQLVLRFADNRSLTPLFQDQVERELREHLQTAFGKLVRVTVARAHPKLQDVLARGLQTSLDAWDERSELRTQFVLVDLVKGQYRLQARAYDGMTGLSAPVVRRVETHDRGQVARRAAELVERDFALVGTVVKTAGTSVEVAVKGGGLGVPLGRWLKAGDVFAVARVSKDGDKTRAARVEWAHLRAIEDPKDGVCRCRYDHRYEEDRLNLDDATVLGYRALKLPTIRTPLQLRLVDDKTQGFLSGVAVHVSDAGFHEEGKGRTTGPDGLIVTTESLSGVAYVQVKSGGRLLARFVVELVDEPTVVCRISLDAAAVTQGHLELRKDRWIRRVYESLSVAADRVADLNAALDRSLDGALDAARRGHQGLSTEIRSLADERDQIRDSAAKLKGRLDLSEGEQRLQDLQTREKELLEFVGRLEAILKEQQSEKTLALRKLLERARVLESQADFDKALQLYAEVLQASPDQKEVRTHYENLKRAWEPRDDVHRQARVFVYHTWPTLDMAGVQSQIADVEKAFAVCRTNGDRLSSKKLFQDNVAHAAKIRKRLEVLRTARDSEDNRAEIKGLIQLSERLRRLHTEVAAFMNAKE